MRNYGSFLNLDEGTSDYPEKGSYNDLRYLDEETYYTLYPIYIIPRGFAALFFLLTVSILPVSLAAILSSDIPKDLAGGVLGLMVFLTILAGLFFGLTYVLSGKLLQAKKLAAIISLAGNSFALIFNLLLVIFNPTIRGGFFLIFLGVTFVYIARPLIAIWHMGADQRKVMAELDDRIDIVSPIGIAKIFEIPAPLTRSSSNWALTTPLAFLSSIFIWLFSWAVVSAALTGLVFGVIAVIAVFAGLFIADSIGQYLAGAIGFLFVIGGAVGFWLFPAIIFMGLGELTRNAARRLSSTSLENALERDFRGPIFFLRPFRKGQIRLPSPKPPKIFRLLSWIHHRNTLDALLLEEASQLGPVISLGSQDEKEQSLYGTRKTRYSLGEWKERVKELASNSAAIVICLDEAVGVEWELDYIISEGLWNKTLFILPPDASDAEYNKRLLDGVIDRLRSHGFKGFDQTVPNILGFFFKDGKISSVGSSDTFSEISYLLMVRWFFRAVIDFKSK